MENPVVLVLQGLEVHLGPVLTGILEKDTVDVLVHQDLRDSSLYKCTIGVT